VAVFVTNAAVAASGFRNLYGTALAQKERAVARTAVLSRSSTHESYHLAPFAFPAGLGDVRRAVCVPGRLQTGLASRAMIWFTIIVTVLLFIYLLAALLRPEWF
jgi:K+-transporting ATPase KdpF subunit